MVIIESRDKREEVDDSPEVERVVGEGKVGQDRSTKADEEAGEGQTKPLPETKPQQRRIIVAPLGYGVCDCRGRIKHLMHVYSDGGKYYCPLCNHQLVKYA